MKTFFLPMLLICSSGHSQTIIGGGIFANSTWNLNGSPYHVTEDVILFDGHTLIIEPGVQVLIAAGKTIELRNSGLQAIGTAELPIVFDKLGTQRWGGFRPVGNTDPLWTGNQVQMEHCIGRSAVSFMDLDIAYHTPYNFFDCEFSDNLKAFDEGGSSSVNNYRIERCYFHDNTTGIEDGYFYTIRDCVFENNVTGSNGGKIMTGSTFMNNELGLSAGGFVDNNIFFNNDVAVQGNWNSENHTFTNNTVVENGIGIKMGTYFDGSHEFTNNTICRNTVYDIQRIEAGSNNTASIQGNCFCTNDMVELESSIFHAMDDLGVGLIVFQPVDESIECLNFSLGSHEVEMNKPQVFPNPTHDQFTLRTKRSSPMNWKVIDSRGATMFQFRTAGNDHLIKVDDWAPGLYLLMNDEGVVMKVTRY